MKRLPFQARQFTTLTLLMLFAVGLTACDSNIAGTEASADNDLIVRTSGGDFTTLAQAIEAAQLTATLRSDGPFTVFAPTDEAFAKLPESALRTLLLPENQQQLAEVLTAHVVAGRVFASDVFELSSAKTLDGSDLDFREEGGTIFVNGARIVATDIEATNGVVHVIDTVLLPEWFESWFSRSDIGIDPLENP